MYPQGACRIRKAPSSPTAAQYFKLFKPQDWRKRSAEARRRNCAVLPKTAPAEHPVTDVLPGLFFDGLSGARVV